MLKEKLEEEIKSYEIAKKDTIEAEGRMVTRYDSTKTETGWLAAGYLELVNMLKKSIENFEQERRYINIGDLVTIDLFQNNRCEAAADSLCAPMSLVNALITAVMAKRRKNLLNRLEMLEDICNQYGT